MSEVPKINLDDIKINTTEDVPIDSDKIKTDHQSQQSVEVIEILDDDYDVKLQNKTPSKSKEKQETISNYFETQYKIKRTPDKTKESEDDFQTTPKVKSPFFVRKTPGSGKKHGIKTDVLDDDNLSQTPPPKRNKKVSKSLFTTSENQNIKSNENDVKPIDPLEMAAKSLKENKSHEELESLAANIAKEKRELELDRNKQGRMGTSITDKMSYECMQLLRLFGIPYIVAPMEAEAQCAFLNAINLTDGTITDDSDIWLFGGKTVYKNFFNQKQHVLEFRIEEIEKLFNVDRKKLIQLAILVGSDYTTGISGIGAVTALEILATFSTTPQKDGETTEVMSVLSSLRKFREWWQNNSKLTSSNGSKISLRNKLKNIEISEGFPNYQIVEAYLNPKIDISREKFTWGVPDVETIREFTKKNFGWTKIKTDEILQPVLKKLNEKKIQTSIKNYFSLKSALKLREVKVSKRVQKAINKLSLDSKDVETEEVEENKSKSKKSLSRVRKAKRTEASTSKVEENNVEDKVKQKKLKRKNKLSPLKEGKIEEIASTSSSSERPLKPKLSKLLAPNTSSEVIPQRERDSEEMRKRKEKAAELLRKSKENQKGKKH